MRSTSPAPPYYSFIIPVHNEAQYLVKRLRKLTTILQKIGINKFEIIVIENGSRDSTWSILKKTKIKNLRALRLTQASYGQALKHGVLSARGKFLFLLNIDFFDKRFITQAAHLLEHYPIVVGSKALAQSRDQRNFARLFGTRILNFFLRTLWRYPGTDTHGLKALRNTKELIQAVYECSAKHEFFDTQLLFLLSQRKWHLKEIPVSVKEVRPSRYTSWSRLSRSAVDVYRLITFSLFHNQKSETWPVVADDYGLSNTITNAILSQLEAKTLGGVSVLANLVSPAQTRALKKARKKPMKLALHFNLSRGRPVARPEDVPTLTNKQRVFWGTPLLLVRLLIGRARTAEIEKELIAQYQRMTRLGLIPNSLDSEQHLHTFGPVNTLVVRFAKKHDLTVRSTLSTTTYLRLRPHKYLFFFLLQKLFLIPSLWQGKRPHTQGKFFHARITHPGNLYD